MLRGEGAIKLNVGQLKSSSAKYSYGFSLSLFQIFSPILEENLLNDWFIIQIHVTLLRIKKAGHSVV